MKNEELKDMFSGENKALLSMLVLQGKDMISLAKEIKERGNKDEIGVLKAALDLAMKELE